jgi:[NiFe] hydrogenase diaphorase moiety large subunit
MSERLQQLIEDCAAQAGHDPTRLMDVVRAVQARAGCVSGEAMELIARELKTPRVEVEGVVSFYAFLSEAPRGRAAVRVSDCVACRLKGAEAVMAAFERELGLKAGEATADGRIGLEWTACIGLCDQGPAALVNEVPVTYLSTDKVQEIVRTLRESDEPRKLVRTLGEGKNASELIHSMVINNVRKKGAVIFAPMEPGAALRKMVGMSPREVLNEVKTARLRGRGGAGFPAGMKWEFARGAAGGPKYVVCNADEGEPGTFKDRVILTEAADLLFEGMAVAGYAIGAEHGILYLRGEYEYLGRHLEHVLAERRKAGLLGEDILGKQGFSFDIRIQMGAGAYICGEESALLNSCEGKRGAPRDRPPFPVEVGYLGKPTSVNNVETLCCAARILEKGAGWFGEMGSKDSSGTKVFSVSGDCSLPGVYELPFGLTLAEFLKTVGGEDALAVQVGGPSGTCVDREGFGRRIAFEDLATGGSMIVLGPERDPLEVASHFMRFFVHESCGWCVPCRVGNVLLLERLERIRAGQGVLEDLAYLEDLGATVKRMSRCGLGQTSPNPVLSTLKAFRGRYEAKLRQAAGGLNPTFDLNRALEDAVRVQGRAPVFHD